MRAHILILTTTFGLLNQSAAPAAVRYVKPTASGTGDCTSWANACTLPAALSLAETGDDLWVKSGTYAPITLKNGVRIIGGFAGTETLASQSNPISNVSIIDGGSSDRCVSAAGEGASTVLRGFTIRNGRDTDDEGGALLLDNSSALFVQCIFEENSATHFGGAVSIHGSGSPQFINCTFRKNGLAATSPRDTKAGGAIFVREGAPMFVNCLFYNNNAGEGGAIFVREASPTLINCTLADNQATLGYGGALFDPDGRATLKNCILWSNTAAAGLGQANQIFAGSGGRSLADDCDIQSGWVVGSNIIDVDPMFVSPAGGNYKFSTSSSPCVNVGQDVALPPDIADLDWDGNTTEPTPYDLARLTRIMLGPVDLGAYEIQMEDIE